MTEQEFNMRLRLLEKKHAFLAMRKRQRERQREFNATQPALLRRQAG